MKFFGRGVQWNPALNKADWVFVRGEFETNDPDVIAKMFAAGFEHEGELPPAEPAAAEGDGNAGGLEGTVSEDKPGEAKELTRNELIVIAKEKGVKGADHMTKDELLALLGGDAS